MKVGKKDWRKIIRWNLRCKPHCSPRKHHTCSDYCVDLPLSTTIGKWEDSTLLRVSRMWDLPSNAPLHCNITGTLHCLLHPRVEEENVKFKTTFALCCCYCKDTHVMVLDFRLMRRSCAVRPTKKERRVSLGCLNWQANLRTGPCWRKNLLGWESVVSSP